MRKSKSSVVEILIVGCCAGQLIKLKNGTFKGFDLERLL
jgi:hypothetical protein